MIDSELRDLTTLHPGFKVDFTLKAPQCGAVRDARSPVVCTEPFRHKGDHDFRASE